MSARLWLGLLGCLLCAQAQTATITIVNADGVGEGFNSTTSRAPEGGNAGTTLGQLRLNVFRRAAEIWGHRLTSAVPIRVEATFDNLECDNAGAVLGSAGPTDFFVRNNRFVPVALHEALAGNNQQASASDPEIVAQFNAAIDTGCLNGASWWYGIDPNVAVPAGRIPLLQTVLHELGHGLGFLSLVCLETSCDQPGFTWPRGGYPNGTLDRWSDFQRDRLTGSLWNVLSNSQRFNSATSNNLVVWDGTNVNAEFSQVPVAAAALNSNRVELHAPSIVQLGSSVSHWSVDSNAPDLLMEPIIGSTGFIDQLDLTSALLKDLGWTVSAGSGPTRTQITSDSPDPSGSGVSYSVAATVTSVSGGITGTVTMTEGSNTCTTPNLVAGSGSCNLTSSGSGNRTVVATYNGNSTRAPSSDVEQHSVGGGGTPTTTTLSDAPDPSVVGQAYTVSASVSASSGTPAGTVAVSDGAGANCTITLSGGLGSCQLTSTTAGSKTLTGTYSGAGVHNGSSDTELHLVNKAATSVTISSDNPDPSVFGQSVTVAFALAVDAPGAGTPTGSVTISAAGGSETCTVNLPATSCALALTAVGSRALTASYSGDANFNADTSPSTAHTVNRANALVAISADTPDPSVTGQTVQVQFSVSALAPGAGTPGGTVTVGTGTAGESCTATLPTLSCNLVLLSTGIRTLTASYSGNSNFNASSSAGIGHTVNKADVALVITGDQPDPSVPNQPVNLQFTIAGAAPGSGTPSGQVTVFASGGVESCTAILPATSCQLNLVNLGLRNLTANYSGDDNFNFGSSAAVTHTVQPATTTTTITGDGPDPSVVGQNYTVAVSVSSPGSPLTGIGVNVNDGAGSSCVASLNAQGTGSCTLGTPSAGARTLTASFPTTGIFTGSSDTEAHTNNPATTQLNINSQNPNPSVAGQLVTVGFGLTVSAPGTGSPAGSVIISATGGSETCMAALPASSCQIRLNTVGMRSLSASYPGNGDFLASSSASVNQVVNPDPDVLLIDGFE